MRGQAGGSEQGQSKAGELFSGAHRWTQAEHCKGAEVGLSHGLFSIFKCLLWTLCEQWIGKEEAEAGKTARSVSCLSRKG